MALLLFYFLLAILVSFLCSMLEAVLLTVTPSYIESLKQRGKVAGEYLGGMKDNIDRPLAAILSLNTIAHTVGSAGVGAGAAKVWGSNSLGMVSAVLTFAILVFSELIPKTLGVKYWRQLAPSSAMLLRGMIVLLYPFVLLSRLISKMLKSNEKGAQVSRAEISAMADLGEREGVFEASESRILKNLFRFREITVEDIMTPRTVVVAAEESLTVSAVYHDRRYLRFSRIPIYTDDKDHITGYIHKHELLDRLANDEHGIILKDIRREILMVKEDTPIPRLFDDMTTKREHIAVALDEYGGVAGLVTMEDILETLIGTEIMDEFDNKKDMQSYARSRWEERAKKLGIIPESGLPEASTLQPSDDRPSPENIDRLQEEKRKISETGITGGATPSGEDNNKEGVSR